MSIFAWLIYISVGLFIMMEALVEAWSWEEYATWIKVVGSILSVVFWPLIFFM